MKKQILKACTLAAASLLITSNSFAQWNSVSGVPNAIETDPIIDDIRFSTNGSPAPIRSIRGEADNGYFEIYGNHEGNNGPGLFMYSNNVNTTNFPWGSPGKIALWSSEGPSDNNGDVSLELIHNEPGIGQTPLFVVSKDGDIKLKYNNVVTFPANYNSIRGNAPASGLLLYGNTEVSNGSTIRLFGDNHPTHGGSIDLVSNPPGGNYNSNGWTFSTHYNGNWGEALTLKNDGTLIPNGLIEFKANQNNWHRHISGNSENGGLYITAYSGWNNGASIIMNSDNNGGHMAFTSTTGNGPDGTAFIFNTNGVSSEAVLIRNNGKVRIGGTGMNMDPDYKLFVETGIMTEKLKVAVRNSTSWSDYVFADDYELKSLNEVESYINDNKHLPDVPSAEEVTKDGIDVATMDATLLRKIEELTLYVIQQQKEINELKAKLSK